MTSQHWLVWLGALTAGIGLGVFFFGFLWWTVRRIPTLRHPLATIVGGYAARLFVALGVFYLVARYGDWPSLVICLAAFIGTRLVLVRLWGGEERPVENNEGSVSS